MRVRAVTWAALAAEVTERVLALGGGRPDHPVRVAVDGAPAAGPEAFADALVDPLLRAGRPAIRVSARGFWRAASLRLEYGREDPQAYAGRWLDDAALRREVLDPLGPGGDRRYLPALWDVERDRATRAAYETAPAHAVLVVDGTLLLGRGLPFDLTVHLHLSAAALARRTPDAQRWTIAAYEDYDERVRPQETADVVVRADDPQRPAIREP